MRTGALPTGAAVPRMERAMPVPQGSPGWDTHAGTARARTAGGRR
jgi:hypothetical protein